MDIQFIVISYFFNKKMEVLWKSDIIQIGKINIYWHNAQRGLTYAKKRK